MAEKRRETTTTVSARADLRPRSPAEALEPGRAPVRPKGVKVRRERKALTGFVRLFSGLLTLGLFLMVLTAGSVALLQHHFEQPGPLKEQHTVAIPKGDGVIAIADRLAAEGVISNSWAFVSNYKLRALAGSKMAALKHGEYVFKPGATMREVLDVLGEGKSIQYKVTVPEGLTSQQIVERLNAEETLTGDVAVVPPEGAILPETYAIEKGMARQDVLDLMLAKRDQVLQAAWDKRQADLPIKTPEEALVLASVIEKETGRADERDKIGGVFINRLRKGMRLQSDPTILYGLYGGAVQWGKPILQTEIDAKNAHNTYQIKGLPPTPICNPGKAAIEAALNPAQTADLYFVADGTGGHTFSDTLKEHNQAATAWRKVEKGIRAKQDAAPDAPAAKPDAAKAPDAGRALAPKADAAKPDAPKKAEPAKSAAPKPAAAAAAPDAPAVAAPVAVDAIPNPPAESAAAAAPVAAPIIPVTSESASSAGAIPPPVKKPKK